MSEKCPLSGGQMSIGGTFNDIPDFCREHCERLWDEATRNFEQDSDYDHYGDDPKGCDGETENSHDALQSVDDSAIRIYSLVDRCIEHEVEVGEQRYTFECPHN